MGNISEHVESSGASATAVLEKEPKRSVGRPRIHDYAAIAEDYREGLSITDICAKHGNLSKGYIHTILHKEGVSLRRARKTKKA